MIDRFSLYPLLLSDQTHRISTNSVQTLLAISHAIEDTVTLRGLRGVFYAGFQRLSAFLPQALRFQGLANYSEVLIFGVPDVPAPVLPGVTYVTLDPQSPLAQEWFLVFDHPDFQVALLTRQVGGSSTAPLRGLEFGRGRDYEGGVSLLPTVAANARARLDEALQRTAGAVVTAGPNQAEAVAFFNRRLIGYMEQRSQQIISLYSSLAERNRQLEQLQGLLRSLLSQSAVMQVESDSQMGTSDAAWQKTRTATILFTDVEGFTRLNESLAPDILVYNLNRYLDVLATTVYQSGGDIDKFLGDGMMAFFETPRQAVIAALRLQRRLAVFNDQQMAAQQPVLRTRIGVATGSCVMARVGSRDRQEITLLGDVVNLASRLQALAPVDGLLIDAATYAACGSPAWIFGRLQTIRGKAGQQMIYEITFDQLGDLDDHLRQNGSHVPS